MRSVTHMLAALACAALLLPACKRKSPPPVPGAPGSPLAVAAAPAVLAELPVGPEGPQAPQRPEPELVFAEHGGGVAWIESSGGAARVLHNGRAGKEYDGIGRVVLGADGRRCGYEARSGATWRVVVDGEEGRGFDELGGLVFSPDGAHFAYDGRIASSWYLVVDGAMSAGRARRFPWKAFDAGSSRIAFLEQEDDQGWGRLVVSDLALANRTVVDERAARPALSPDRTVVAAVSERGDRQQLVTARLDAPAQVSRGRAYDGVSTISFGAGDPTSVAYFAERGGEYLVVLGDREERVPQGESVVERPVVCSDPPRVAVALIVQGGVRVREFFRQGSAPERLYGGVEGLGCTRGGGLAYVADRDGRYFVVSNGSDGPAFDRVVSPAFSPDGRYLVYRARSEGKRFVVVADANGKTIRQHPAYEQVFPVRFTADGKSVAYGVKDGRKLAWKVEPL